MLKRDVVSPFLYLICYSPRSKSFLTDDARWLLHINYDALEFFSFIFYRNYKRKHTVSPARTPVQTAVTRGHFVFPSRFTFTFLTASPAVLIPSHNTRSFSCALFSYQIASRHRGQTQRTKQSNYPLYQVKGIKMMHTYLAHWRRNGGRYPS